MSSLLDVNDYLCIYKTLSFLCVWIAAWFDLFFSPFFHPSLFELNCARTEFSRMCVREGKKKENKVEETSFSFTRSDIQGELMSNKWKVFHLAAELTVHDDSHEYYWDCVVEGANDEKVKGKVHSRHRHRHKAKCNWRNFARYKEREKYIRNAHEQSIERAFPIHLRRRRIEISLADLLVLVSLTSQGNKRARSKQSETLPMHSE